MKKQFDRPGEEKWTATKETITLLPPSQVMCVCLPQLEAAHQKTRQFWSRVGPRARKDFEKFLKKNKKLIWCHIF